MTGYLNRHQFSQAQFIFKLIEETKTNSELYERIPETSVGRLLVEQVIQPIDDFK